MFFFTFLYLMYRDFHNIYPIMLTPNSVIEVDGPVVKPNFDIYRVLYLN